MLPAAIENDANAAALGEYRFGAGKNTDPLLYLTVSTGVGGGWILGGEVYGGANGTAGEIGHTVVNPVGMPCVCGKCGCVEAEASGTAADNALARLILTESARYLGRGIGNAINLMNPRRVILGGGVIKAGELWWNVVRYAARRYTLPEIQFGVPSAMMRRSGGRFNWQ